MAKINPIFLFLVALAGISWLRYANSPSPDLLATWMAGKYYGAGMFDQIYPDEPGAFTMRPPSDWEPSLRANGYKEAIYPFIYPPIWAWFGALLHRMTSFETVSTVASFLNPLMLGATIWLAAGMVAEKLTQTVFILVVVALFATSTAALVALEQNQPQILVTFLMVLAVERARAGSPVAAGIALAIAASIKLYPAIFALFWWARGEKGAAGSFALFGALVGLLSVALAGWPLHVAFLSEIRAISGSVLLTFFTYSIDPTIAKHFFADQLQVVPILRVLDADETAAILLIMEKPAIWRIADVLALLGVIVALYLTARSPKGQDVLFWPIAFTAIALVSPLSWGYHYLAALAFAPGLIERYGLRPGALAIFAVFFPLSTLFIALDLPLIQWAVVVQPLATLAMAFYAVILWFALRKQA